MSETVRYRHWQNRAEGGDTVFLTTTVLDFVHAFSKGELADLMVASFAEDCRRMEAPIGSFVLMSHHLHAIVRLPFSLSASRFAQRVKSNSARRILPLLDHQTRAQLAEQAGLNNRSFWMRGFRSIPITTGRVFAQKQDYIALNPVRAGLVKSTELYRWSSAFAIERNLACSEGYLDPVKIRDYFAPNGLPPVNRSIQATNL